LPCGLAYGNSLEAVSGVFAVCSLGGVV